jgi:uncharacterized protein (TIGR03435 family)
VACLAAAVIGDLGPRTVAHGQADAFDVASIRRNKAAEEERAARIAASPGIALPPGRARTQAGGTLNGTAMTVRELIRDAYGYRNRALSDVTGGPDWLDQERYDVIARASIEFPASSMLGIPPDAERLLRKLLQDRFGLKVRTEARRRDIYEMQMAREGKLGDGIKRSEGTCLSFYAFSTSPAVAGAGAAAQSKPVCSFVIAGGTFSGGNMTMEELSKFLPAFPSINTTVVDKTGLQGGYDFTVLYQLANVAAVQSAEVASRPLFNQAFEQQTGIKLVKTQGPVEVLIVESVERPTDN